MDSETTIEPPWDRYRAYLKLMARASLDPKLRHKLDASDLAQEALLKACKEFHQYRGESEPELKAWLRKILRNTVIDQYRAVTGPTRDVNLERSLDAALEQTSARLEEWLRDSSDGPVATVMKEDLLDQIARAIDHLPENQQTAVELYYIHEYSVARIGEEMGLSKKAVGGLIERGVKAIRKKMNEAS